MLFELEHASPSRLSQRNCYNLIGEEGHLLSARESKGKCMIESSTEKPSIQTSCRHRDGKRVIWHKSRMHFFPSQSVSQWIKGILCTSCSEMCISRENRFLNDVWYNVRTSGSHNGHSPITRGNERRRKPHHVQARNDLAFSFVSKSQSLPLVTDIQWQKEGWK